MSAVGAVSTDGVARGANVARVTAALLSRLPNRGLGQQLQHLLAGGAAFDVLHQLIEFGVNETVIQKLLEPTGIGAGCHSISTDFRIMFIAPTLRRVGPITSVTEDKNKKNC